MKHVTTAEKSLLFGDEAADLLMEYASLLAQHGSADTVTMVAFGVDGAPVEATFLLNSGTTLMIETSTAPFEEPDNSETIAYIRERMSLIESPPNAQPSDAPPATPDWEI